MRKSDPRVRIVFLQKHDSNPNYIFAVQATGRNFQYGLNFGVPSNPTLRVRYSSPLASVHEKATDSVYCGNSSVSCVMKCCSTSTVVKNPALVQILITQFSCESFSTRSWYFGKRSSCAGSSVEGVGVSSTNLSIETMVRLCGGVLSPGDPVPQRLLVHDIKEEESGKQKEVLEAKDDEEMDSEVDGEVGEKVTQRVHETWRWRWDEQGTNFSHSGCTRNQRTRKMVTTEKTHYTQTISAHSPFFSCSREC